MAEKEKLVQVRPGLYVTRGGSVYRDIAKYNGLVKKHPMYSKSCNDYLLISNGEKLRLRRLIAEAFVPNPNGYPYVGVKDGNYLNCKADNLFWYSIAKSQNAPISIRTLCDRISMLCGERGLSVAEACTEIGYSRSAVSNWLNKGSYPRINTLIDFADFFGVSTDYLLGRAEHRDVRNG